MRLFVMRHGPAVDATARGRDFDRTLSEIGRGVTRAVAEELVRRGEIPRRIIASPLVRAVETARIVAEVLATGAEVETRPELAPTEDSSGLVAELARVTESALLVAHAPDVSVLTEMLLRKATAAFSPARVVALDLEDGRASVRFVIEPPPFFH